MEKKLKILVTAGSTVVPIDQVRGISNIFKGRTGAEIALFLSEENMEVTLVTSNKRVFDQQPLSFGGRKSDKIIFFRTYDELLQTMEHEIKNNSYDVIIHSAAVSDYRVSEVCVLENKNLITIDSEKKVSSSYDDLYLHLTPTEKIIDLIREPWGFRGYLVKFKLQVGISDNELIQIARNSRVTSKADMIVANCLEWAKKKAYIIADDFEDVVSRDLLPEKIYKVMIDKIVGGQS